MIYAVLPRDLRTAGMKWRTVSFSQFLNGNSFESALAFPKLTQSQFMRSYLLTTPARNTTKKASQHMPTRPLN
jgi:hypothetical protein